ncbi:MAG: DUF1572 family protein [Chitinophagaceae bacterium]|nr:DUF1572 family protein [Chitinophagaceae bacterium]
MESNFLTSAIKQFEYYQQLGEKTFHQLPDDKLFWQYNAESNSIATIVKHLHGNMLSRWTNFLHSDGEKEWRNRDAEFENDITTREEMLKLWHAGWQCLYLALKNLKDEDLNKVVFIRNQGQTVVEAINRQLCHYSYHVGQIVCIGKMICNQSWQSLSIPKGKSVDYNTQKFAQEKHIEHFTDESLRPIS